MIEFLDSVSLQEAGRRAARQGRLDRGAAAVKRAISTQPVVKPIKVNAPNSVFALGNAFANVIAADAEHRTDPWT